MTPDPTCWLCCLFPANVSETVVSFNKRLDANHTWTGGQHVSTAAGGLRLPASSYEREDSLSEIIAPLLPSTVCRRCGTTRTPGRACMSCAARTVRLAQGWSA